MLRKQNTSAFVTHKERIVIAMKLALASAVAGVALTVGLQSGIAQQAAPTQNKAVTIKQLDTIDLGPEIQGMTGRQFRMRLITVEPGGVLGLHDHKDRP